jgi:DNA-binding CsgD family transcriptional regulator
MGTDASRVQLLDTVIRRLEVEGSPVIVARDGDAPLVAYAMMDTGMADYGMSAPLVNLTRLDDLPAPSDRALKVIYDLTPAEVRLAQGISRGDSLEEVAADLGIRITTARTQLASIFAKTNTRRQARLVAILSHLAHLER